MLVKDFCSLPSHSYVSLTFKDLSYFIVSTLSVCGYVNVHSGVCEGQKETRDSLDLELWVGVSRLTWVLGTELRSLVGAASALTLNNLSSHSPHALNHRLLTISSTTHMTCECFLFCVV